MADSLNPYQPPGCQDWPESWLRRFISWILRTSEHPIRDFRKGQAILFEGIAYFIEPKDKLMVYAASPSRNVSDDRMQLIVAESTRLLPEFLSSYPELTRTLAGRRMVVRMIHHYSDTRESFIRQIELESAIVPTT